MPGGADFPFRPNDPELRRVLEQVFSDFIRRDKADRKKQKVETSLPDRFDGEEDEVRLLTENGTTTFIHKTASGWERIGAEVAATVSTPTTSEVTEDTPQELDNIVTPGETQQDTFISPAVTAAGEAEIRFMTNEDHIDLIAAELFAINAMAANAQAGEFDLTQLDGGTY